MGIFDIFRKDSGQPDQPAPVPTGEVGYSFSTIYTSGDFPRYNPDSLLINRGRAIYDKMMEDDQVKAVMLFKQMAVVSRKYFFDVKVSDDGVKDTEQEKIADFFQVVINCIVGSWSDKLIEILSAMKYGFSVCEKIFIPVKYDSREYWGLQDIKLRPFNSFDGGFKTDKHGNITTIVQMTDDATEIKIPPNKVIHFVYQPDIDRHYGESDLRTAYRPYWSKDVAIKFENIHLERHAHGFIWAQTDPAKGALTSKQISDLESVLDNITAKTSLHVPASVEINTIQPLRTDAYNLAIQRHDKAIAKSLLVPNLLGLSEQGSTGSYAQSSTQLEAFFWILDFMANRLAEALNEQLFRDLSIWNFGTEDFPQFKFEPISDSKKLEIIKQWNEMVKGHSVTKSDSDEAYVRQIMDFPKKEEQGELPDDSDHLPVEQPDEVELSDWLSGKDRQLIKEFAESPWMRRVNFVKIEKGLNAQDMEFSRELSMVMGQVRLSLEKQIVSVGGTRSWGNVNPKEVGSIKIPATLVSKIRKVIRTNTEASLNSNYETARRELPVKKFAKINPGMTKDKAMQYLSSAAMRGAQTLDHDVIDAIRIVLQNAIKYDKSLRDTIASLNDNTTLATTLPQIDAAGRAVNIPARLETIARTNTADAMNQARTSLFNNPELKGFVQAFEYAAILDDRITDICEHLNGKKLRDFANYTPPNHFNCRSILIAITKVDDWNGKESAPPSQRPQKGFY